MRTVFNRFLAATALSLLFIASSAQAQVVLGRDYRALEPAQATDSPEKIEVIEFFSYGCPHCNEFHPLVSQWSAKLPSDVTFKRVPVGFNQPYYINLATMYYALETIGELKRLDNDVFHAIHGKGLKLVDEKSITDWVGLQGVDVQKFSDAYRSFGVSSKVRRADQMAQAYQVRGVPSIAVDGRYLMLNSSSLAQLLSNTDQVIAKVRSERQPKKNKPK